MKKSLLLLFLSCLFMSAQVMAQITVTGKVTDEGGESLIGVNIVEKGTTNGTVTDLDGNYSIRVADGATLVFSYVGFETFERLADGGSIDVELADANILDEVVVTGLNIAKEERAITSATQQLDGSEFTKARESNIVNSLSGQIAGVQVTNTSGAVGSSSRLVIRGVTTLSGDNQPLYVVDGIPLDNRSYATGTSTGGVDRPNGISEINPDDIESVSVLKGPKAAALYGARAANGVVMITTKSGSSSKKALGVEFNSTTTFKNPLVIPDYQNSYGQGGSKDYFEWIDGSGFGGAGAGDGGVDESWGPPLDVGLEFVQWNSYTVDGAPLPWVSQPDNIKNFYETGIGTSNSLAFSGATDNINYRLSFGHNYEKGLLPNTDISKYTLNAASGFDITDKLRSTINVNYTKTVSGNLPEQGYAAENFVQQTIWSGRNVDFSLLKDWENLPLSPEGTNAEGTPLNWNTVFQNNPYWVLDNNINQFNKDRLLGSLGLSYEFTDFLSIRVRTGVDYYSQLFKRQKAKGSNEFIDGYYAEEFRTWFEQNSEALLSFDDSYADDRFGVSAFVGGNLMQRKRELIFTDLASGIEIPGLFNISNAAAGTNASVTNRTQNQKINSVYAGAEFSWDRAFFVDASVRTDWFSVLGEENNSVTYPSVGAGFVASEYIPKNDYLSWLKVRGSWAKVGSIGALVEYRTSRVFNIGGDPFGSVPLVFEPATLNNPDLVPETTVGYEIGADMKLFKNHLSVDVSYYNQTSEDLLITKAVSSASGYTQAWANVGEINNKGVELQADATLYRNKDLNVGVTLNWAKNKNLVVDVDGEGGGSLILAQNGFDTRTEAIAGMPYGVIKGHGYAKDPNGNTVYEDGLPVITDDLVDLGNIQPDWTGGVALNLTWKGLTFSTLFDTRMGGEVQSNTYLWGRYAGTLEESLIGRETGVIGDGVKNIGTASEPVYVTNDVVVDAKTFNQTAYNASNVTEGGVFDASYVKWRQLLVGYTLPAKLFENNVVDEISISFVARNLAILYKKAPHIDPETAHSSADTSQGLEFGQIPSTRSLGFNVNVKF